MRGHDHTDVVLITDAADAVTYLALHAELRWRLAPILSEAGLRHDAISVTFESAGGDLRVRLVGPNLDEATKDRVTARVVDGLRATNADLADVEVFYDDCF